MVTGRTWVPEPPKGARFDRHVELVGADGKPRVRAKTTWDEQVALSPGQG